ncbi:large-conductance mechanosensitive channel protein MscL [Candidatus Kaiserbacteria bacterium]|nr:large-conductance mechanosensitive channel protein MscL [Candidatus Kaiserbacteria bacterium]
MKKFFEEFKTFAMRGNVVDMAVGIVIGAAFGKIVSSLVENIITPLASVLTGGVNFADLSTSIGDTVFPYGAFIQSVVDFVIIAFAIFVAIKVMNRLQDEEEGPKKKKKESEEVKLLREIRDSLQKE